MKRIINTLIILTFLGNSLFSQTSNDTIIKTKKYYKSIHFSVENGAMLGNSNELSEAIVNSSYYNGLDLRMGWSKKDPLDTYNRVYRFPTMGIGYYSSTFHNDYVGTPNALYFFMQIPIKFEGTRKWTASYSGAFGLSYNFNPFDSINNPTNIFIGSYRNCYVQLGFNLKYQFNNKLSAFATIGYKHFSNGSFKQPNYGINLLPIGIGVSYKFTDEVLLKPETPINPFIKHNQFNLMLGLGSKNYINNDPNYFKMTLGVNYLRQVGYRYRLGVGLDFFYAARSDLRNDSGISTFSNSVSYAVVGSWEWVVSKVVSVPIGLGYYLHRNEENGEKKNYYERVGLRFRINEHYNLGVTIKAHKGTADYFEWTLAYTFHKDPNNYR